MSSAKFELEAEIREDIGKGASRRLRHANKVPAVIYGAGEPPLSLTLNHDKVTVALAHEGFYSHILSLKVGKKIEKVILKAMQRSPSRPRVQHMDFLRIRADQKLTMHIPLHFIGEDQTPGVKAGGAISHLMSDLEVTCLPADLPEFIEVDVSELELDQSIHMSQLTLPKGVELTAFAHGVEGHDQAVVSVHIPRIIEEEVVEISEEEAAAPEGEGEAAAAPAAESAEENKKD